MEVAEPKALVDSLRRRRGGALNEADRIVLHAPRFARGWDEIGRAVRLELGLPAKLCELAVIGVGQLNGAPFQVRNHGPAFLKGGGTAAQLQALERFEAAAEDEALFDDIERAVMRLAIEMTRNIEVKDRTFAQIQRVLPSTEAVVEMVGVIAMYNMVSRFLIALKIED
jgi:alkylhydroperoxidase family enzyme